MLVVIIDIHIKVLKFFILLTKDKPVSRPNNIKSSRSWWNKKMANIDIDIREKKED